MSRHVRAVLVTLVGVAVLVVASSRLVESPALLLPRDFLEYWSAGVANLHGENPYDPEVIGRYQRAANPARTDTVMMWNPPWSLALYMPLGVMSARWATLLWLVGQLAAVMLSCHLLWLVFAGEARRWWVAQLVGLTFVGSWAAISFGQNTGLILLGLAGYAYFRQTDRPGVAGLFAALTALKPHLLAVFGVMLVLELGNRKGRITLAVGTGIVCASLVLAALANPHVISQFREALRNPGPAAIPLTDWVLPVPAYWLRVWIDPTAFWIQFVPCVLVCVGYLCYCRWTQRNCSTREHLPAVVWLSVLTTPYGGWLFDLCVLLVPLISVSVRLVMLARWWPCVILFTVSLAVTVVANVLPFELHQYFWVAPVVLLVHIAALALTRGRVCPVSASPTRAADVSCPPPPERAEA